MINLSKKLVFRTSALLRTSTKYYAIPPNLRSRSPGYIQTIRLKNIINSIFLPNYLFMSDICSNLAAS